MNQTFDLERFYKLVSKHWMENYKRYGLTLLAIGGLLAAWRENEAIRWLSLRHTKSYRLVTGIAFDREVTVSSSLGI